MEKELFNDLVDSLKEAVSISKGKKNASRSFRIEATDVKTIREKAGLTQSQLATLMRVSIKTLQNWEQHRRNPTGPAAALLKIVSSNPKMVMKYLHVA